jgi:integrase
MNPRTNLELPKKDRPKGLFLFCNKCDRQYSHDKKVKCKCGALVYKAKIHVAGTTHGIKPKVLQATNFKDAVQEILDFKELLKNNGYQKIEIKKSASSPTRLIECFAYYMGYLNNVGVPLHKHKNRDPKYIGKFDFLFEQYKTVLELHDIDWKILKFTEVNDDMVGYIHDHFLKTLEYSNKTYNNNMALLSAFTTHIIKEFNLDYKNPFLGVPDRVVTPKVASVKENEFVKLLEIVTAENGIQMKTLKSRKNMKKTNHYKPWLKWGFRLGLYTGGRSEDIVELKWNDVLVQEDGKFDTLRTIDHKIDSANSNITSETERFVKYFAITKELGDLLLEMGYDRYKGTDKYILAPEDGLKRSNISGILSRSFSHYYSQLNTGKNVTFRNLRKTFMTSALREFGEASTALTNHANISMTIKHYQDKEVTRDEAKQSFSVFKSKKQ